MNDEYCGINVERVNFAESAKTAMKVFQFERGQDNKYVAIYLFYYVNNYGPAENLFPLLRFVNDVKIFIDLSFEQESIKMNHKRQKNC